MNQPENQRYGKTLPGVEQLPSGRRKRRKDKLGIREGRAPLAADLASAGQSIAKQLSGKSAPGEAPRAYLAGAAHSSPSIENSQAGTQGIVPLGYRLLFSLPILALFVLWLYPLYRSATSPETLSLMTVMMITAAVLLFWGALQLPGWLLLSLQTACIMMAWMYVAAGEERAGWLAAYPAELLRDMILLLSGHLSELGNASRLLILAAGWGMLVSSVQHLVIYRGSTLLFTVVTLVYLLGLDLAFGINTTIDIMISSGMILWLQGMGGLIRLRERRSSVQIPYARWSAMAVTAAVILIFAAWCGQQLYGSRQMNPVSLQTAFGRLNDWAAKHMSDSLKDLQTGTTGYSLNAAELGTPLTPRTEPVFTAISPESTYWRGESIAYYDGRRWIRGAENFAPLSLTSFPLRGAGEPILPGQRMIRQQIQFAVPSAAGLPVFTAGTVADMESAELADGSRLGFILSNKEGDSLRLPDVAGSAPVTGYAIVSALPESDPIVLRGLSGADPQDIRDKYLQLPSSLPRRVTDLANELTEASGNRYDAAVAVRDYLQNSYPYTLDTKVPQAGADFVDDFLFQAKRGYCVHFATAMTILLRSADIPARFVQGYGPGEAVADAGPQRYAVTQADAHAWVEVYFPGAGWVPFDPTPGGAGGSAQPALPAAAGTAPPPRISPAALRAGEWPALPLPGGPGPAPLYAAALAVPAAAWRWRRSLALLPAARSKAASRERQLRAASLAWHGLAARYGPPLPGVTRREYADSLPIEDAGLRAAVRRFVRQWETLAYSGSSAADGSSPAAPVLAAHRMPPSAHLPSGTAQDAPPGPPQSEAPGRPAHPEVGTGSAGPGKPPATASAAVRRVRRSEPAAEAAVFLRECLRITFRLT